MITLSIFVFMVLGMVLGTSLGLYFIKEGYRILGFLCCIASGAYGTYMFSLLLML